MRPAAWPCQPEECSGLETKFGVQSVASASRHAAPESLATPMVLLRFPPCVPGASTPDVRPQLH